MRNWSLALVLASVPLLAPLFTGAVSAQSETILDTTLESGITTNSDNTTDDATDNATLTKAQILQSRGVPGKGILLAPGLQKPFNAHWKWFQSIEKKLKFKNQEQTAVTEQTQNNGEDQTLRVRERTRQENEIQEQAGTTTQKQNHGAAKELKVKGNKNKP